MVSPSSDFLIRIMPASATFLYTLSLHDALPISAQFFEIQKTQPLSDALCIPNFQKSGITHPQCPDLFEGEKPTRNAHTKTVQKTKNRLRSPLKISEI